MKKLIIMRHAKSSHSDAFSSDYERELNKKGEKNALDMGTYISQREEKPDIILCSSAVRTFQTATLAANQLKYPVESIKTSRKLYLAWMSDIIEELKNLSDNVASCLLIGHNPGMTDLINYFGVSIDNLPTASAVCFEFETKNWNKISVENANFKWYQYAGEVFM